MVRAVTSRRVAFEAQSRKKVCEILRGLAGALVRQVMRRGKPFVYVGDLNCAHTDADLSHPVSERSLALDPSAIQCPRIL